MGIEDFMSGIAAPDPSIAGGHVAAYVGSFAAALGEMMAGLTEGRAGFAAQEKQVQEIHSELAQTRTVFERLAREDSAAYQSVLEARKLPRISENERAFRSTAIERAMKKATEIPLRHARAAFRVLELLNILFGIGNPNARTDVAIGAQLAYASLKSAQYNIATNAREIKDKAFAEDCRKQAAVLDRKAREIIQNIELSIQGS